MRCWIVVFAFLLLFGCVSIPARSSFEVGGLVIRNETSESLDHVEIRVNQKFAKCGFIPSRGFCSTTFPQRTYSGLPADISWISAEQSWVQKDVVFNAMDDGRKGEVATLVISILPRGQIYYSVVR